MQNMETWMFANTYCGRLWWKIGWVMLVPSVLLHVPFYHSTDNMVGVLGGILCTIQCIVMMVPIILTERALRKNF